MTSLRSITSVNQAKRVLIICTGNMCRSPMAVGLLQSLLTANGESAHVAVSSAGTRAFEGRPVSHMASEVMAERDIDISLHRARQLERGDIERADLILAMEERHRMSVLNLGGAAALHKSLLLSELAGGHLDVKDPYGMPVEAYQHCFAEIERFLCAGYDLILQRLDLCVGSRSESVMSVCRGDPAVVEEDVDPTTVLGGASTVIHTKDM